MCLINCNKKHGTEESLCPKAVWYDEEREECHFGTLSVIEHPVLEVHRDLPVMVDEKNLPERCIGE